MPSHGQALVTLSSGTASIEGEAQPLSNPDLPVPSALALAPYSGNEMSFDATDPRSMEAALTLNFVLPGFSSSVGPIPGSSTAIAEAPAQLFALSETSLALVGTLLATLLNAPLVTVLNTPTSASLTPDSGNQAEVNTSFLTVTPSSGQGVFTKLKDNESGSDPVVEIEGRAPVAQGGSWLRFLVGMDEVLDQIHEENQARELADPPKAADESAALSLFSIPVQPHAARAFPVFSAESS